MNLKKYFKKKLMISSITITVIVFILASSSYALFMDVKSNTEDQVITVGNLQITYIGGNAITIDTISPMSDSEALEDSDTIYNFAIDNTDITSNLTYCYTISIVNNPAYFSGGENYNPARTFLSHNYIRYKLNAETPNTLGEQPEGLIYSGFLDSKQAKMFSLRLWVADAEEYSLPNEALGSEVHLNIIVDGKACGVDSLESI